MDVVGDLRSGCVSIRFKENHVRVGCHLRGVPQTAAGLEGGVRVRLMEADMYLPEQVSISGCDESGNRVTLFVTPEHAAVIAAELDSIARRKQGVLV